MTILNSLTDAIGKTPLIRLRRASEETGCEILGKAEFLNPGGSIKDRAALYIIRGAQARGALKPGGVIVEGTAGNTGIGLTLIGNILGCQTIIVMPETQSQEKRDALRLLGADIRLVAPAPYTNPENYIHQSRRLAEKMVPDTPNGVIWANQFDNTDNRQAHYETTGPEIWSQTDGQLDAFTCAVGTGGTLAGVGQALKERNPEVKIVLSDPMGSALCNYFVHGECKAEGRSMMEGIGSSRVTKNLADAPVDSAQSVEDPEALAVVYDLLRTEGLALGGSSGINVAGAMELARQMGPGHRIVTILCDSADRYRSKLFNPTFLREKNLPVPSWLEDAAESAPPHHVDHTKT